MITEYIRSMEQQYQMSKTKTLEHRRGNDPL